MKNHPCLKLGLSLLAAVGVSSPASAVIIEIPEWIIGTDTDPAFPAFVADAPVPFHTTFGDPAVFGGPTPVLDAGGGDEIGFAANPGFEEYGFLDFNITAGSEGLPQEVHVFWRAPVVTSPLAGPLAVGFEFFGLYWDGMPGGFVSDFEFVSGTGPIALVDTFFDDTPDDSAVSAVIVWEEGPSLGGEFEAIFRIHASHGTTGNVPDGGVTAVLLGLSLAGMGIFRRKTRR